MRPSKNAKRSGVEEVAAVGRDRQLVVVHAAVHGPARGQQAVPGRGTALEDLGVLEALPLQRLPQGAHRVEILIMAIIDGQQVVLLGDEQEHGAHHHGDRRFVDLVRCDAGEQRSAPSPVGPRDGVDQQLGGPAHLGAELVGDLGLRAGGLHEQRRRSVPLGRAGETPRMQHRPERVQQDRFGGELRRPPGAPAGGAALWRVDQGEVVSVGDQRQRDAVMATRQS